MPFPEQPHRPFTRAEIEALATNQIGCYGLFHATAWVYIGRGDIRERLLAHLNDDNLCLTREQPTHFVAEVTPNHVAREKALILELGPTRCNQKIG